MTAKELMANVGKIGSLSKGANFRFNVEILDARKCWDRIDYLVRPISGSGEGWVSAYFIKIGEV